MKKGTFEDWWFRYNNRKNKTITMDNKFEWDKEKALHFYEWQSTQFPTDYYGDWHVEMIERFEKNYPETKIYLEWNKLLHEGQMQMNYEEFKKSKQQSEVKDKSWSPADAVKETEKILQSMKDKSYEYLAEHIKLFRDKRTGDKIMGIHGGFGGFQKEPNYHFVKQDMPIYLNDENYEIFKVVNDNGDEFSLGDDIGFFGTIKEFKGEADHISVYTSNPQGKYGQWGWFGLNELTKAQKEPLFYLSEDGHQFYEGDLCWAVSEDLFLYMNFRVGEGMDKSVKLFFTEENARKYIRDNKPSISFNDLHKQVLKMYSEKTWVDVWWTPLLEHFKPKPDTI